jgi:hypothetical protein
MKPFYHLILIVILPAVLMSCIRETSVSSAQQQEISTEPIELSETMSPTEQIPIYEPTEKPTPTEEPTPTESTALPQREDTNFRNTKWGDSVDTVKLYETAELAYEDVGKILTYSGKIAELETFIIYYFDPVQGLYHAVYGLTEKHTTDHRYISDYDQLKALLIERYGEPTTDDIATLNNAASYTDAGSALKYGYTVYATAWDTDNTEVKLVMGADNHEIKTAIDYVSSKVTPTIDVSDF